MTSFQIVWSNTALIMLVCFLVIGLRINRQPFGILIDSRCKMSMARLQLVLWTWLLISAVFALAVTFRSMNIELASDLLALMGISVGSTAGSVIVKGNKAGQEPSGVVSSATRSISRRGLLAINPVSSDAAFADLFKGDELADQAFVDISKVQVFFFTLATLLGYGYSLWVFPFEEKWHTTCALRFPELSQSVVILLGISHAGYLTVKAAPKTPRA